MILVGVDLSFFPTSTPRLFIVFQRCTVYVKPLDGVDTTHSFRNTENATTVGAGWGWPPPFLWQLTQGQNPAPSWCPHALLQGTRTVLIIKIPVPGIPALYLGFSADWEHPSHHFHLRLKAATYKLKSWKGRCELVWRHLPTTCLSCSARRGSKTSTKATELPAPSLFSYGFIGKNSRKKLYNSLLAEMQIAWEKGKRTKPDQIMCVSSFVTCFSPTAAQIAESALSTFSRQG